MLTVEQAKAKILEGAEAVAEVEDMVTLYSAGKILAQDIVSEIKVPPLDNSQMDGYAVRCADFALRKAQHLPMQNRAHPPEGL